MSERRYNEDEVAAIFERAAKAQAAQQERKTLTPLASGDGMTLGQLQEIAREVGIAPEDVASAANAVARTGQETSRRFLGITIGVGRTIEFDRRLTEEEWERIVVDLRETFDARGQMRSEGNFRQWTNGNLQALLEPTATGHRLRIKTMKGTARSLMTAGAVATAFGLVSAVAAALGGKEVLTMLPLGLAGVTMMAVGALQLPAWRRERAQQMADVAARLTESTGDTK